MTRPDMSPVIPAMGGAAERVKRIGSLCTGYGGLDAAVQEVLGGEVAWVADNDPRAAKVLAHRFPSAPNLGDITATDWAAAEPVDILCAGFPCQDISCAGKRAGLRAGTRSGIWNYVAAAIGGLRPSLVVIENVKELLSERADSDMEPCSWCLGDVGDERAMRALGAVLADLAGLGFDAEWCRVRASDVGAPHRRARVFLVAWPAADTNGATGRQRRVAAPGQAEGWRSRPHAGGPGGAPDAHASGGTRRFGYGDDVPAGGRADGRGATSGGGAPANADSGGLPEREERDSGPLTGVNGASGVDPLRRVRDWGAYGPAIHRWEAVLGRPAPRPTEPGRTGERLSPRFTEWMMGLPAGWVTEVPGLSRNDQSHVLGNGVVPQQCALALRLLLAALETLDMAA